MNNSLTSLHTLLCALHRAMRDHLCGRPSGDWSTVHAETRADTIYEVDRMSEAFLIAWFARHWPVEEPVRLVMEGIDDDAPWIFPRGAKPRWALLMDPIDGTRGLMHGKRSAWILSGLAPMLEGALPRLRQIEVAVMTELPVVKQELGDQLSVIGDAPLIATRSRIGQEGETPIGIRPSRANGFAHGFGSVSRFFPEGLVLLAEFEATFWRNLGGGELPVIFNDQYLATGGQLYELLSGHDRFIADVRPLAFAELGVPLALVCHPYDMAALRVAEAAGVSITDPFGQPLDAPFDTVSPVSWVGFANATLAAAAWPAWQAACRTHFPRTFRL